MKKPVSFLLAALIAVSLLLTGCTTTNTGGTLELYTDPNFPPFEFKRGTEAVGVDIEIAKAIAAELGLTLNINEAEFDGIVASISSGKGDIAISGMTITDERKKSVDFSIPYITSVQYLILPVDSTIATMEDLAGKSIGAALGYTGEFVMEDEMAVAEDGTEGVLYEKDVDLVLVNSALDGSLDIVNGRLDAVVMDEFVAKAIVAENTSLKAIKLVYADGSDVAEEYGVVVAKGKEEMLTKINAVIERLLSENKIEEWMIEYAK